MNIFANINEVIPFVLGHALDGFEIITVEGYGGIEEITSKISQSMEKIVINLKGYPTNTTYNDGGALLAASFDVWIKSGRDYTSLLMLIKQAFAAVGARCGINLNGSAYKLYAVYEDAAPVRTNSGLWLKLRVIIYV